MGDISAPTGGRWRYRGLGILKGRRPGGDTPHDPGPEPGAALAEAREIARRIRAGEVPIEADRPGSQGRGAPAGPPDVIYIVRGRACLRWGMHGEFMSEAEAGDAVVVAPNTPYRMLNGAPGRILDCVTIRPDDGATAARVTDIDPPGAEEVVWVDPVRSDA